MKRGFLLLPLWLICIGGVVAESPATIAGNTMGTTYSVKIFDPPADLTDLKVEIDAELRRVNSEMSTYLESSQISRFNLSESTDWFSVSADFANVVASALELSVRTDGSFDVTIGPYIDLWHFGAADSGKQIPTGEQLRAAGSKVGYQKLSVRNDPPAIRKSVPDLQINLSAIAKGHGVDRVVNRLSVLGHKNVFVEIGGEVRVHGDKDGNGWRVGIQVPDVIDQQVLVAHRIGDTGQNSSMATSGDYRNFYEIDGVRYSHTIDPRTASPITHDLASVTVVASDCMTADAWATAINVMGSREGLAVAEANGVDCFLVDRQDGTAVLSGSGLLAKYATAATTIAADQEPSVAAVVADSNWSAMFFITAILFGLVLLAMAIGVIFGRHAISGSCGGIAGTENEDGSVSCSLCSNPADACKDLRERMKQQDLNGNFNSRS